MNVDNGGFGATVLIRLFAPGILIKNDFPPPNIQASSADIKGEWRPKLLADAGVF